MNTGKKHSEIGSLMEVIRDTALKAKKGSKRNLLSERLMASTRRKIDGHKRMSSVISANDSDIAPTNTTYNNISPSYYNEYSRGQIPVIKLPPSKDIYNILNILIAVYEDEEYD